MRFVERDDYELCAQIRTYRSRESKLEFVLFPMVHVGSAEFYTGVRSALSNCDYVLYEGIRSSVSRVLTTSYRIMAKRPRLGLVEQRQALRLSSLPGQLIHADQSTSAFEANWASLPLHTRLLVLVLSPLVGAYRFCTVTRGGLARQLGRSVGEDTDLDPDDVDEVILGRRDAHLVSVIQDFHVQHRQQSARAAIVFGAAHMEAVASFLIKRLRYHTAKAARVQIFPL